MDAKLVVSDEVDDDNEDDFDMTADSSPVNAASAWIISLSPPN